MILFDLGPFAQKASVEVDGVPGFCSKSQVRTRRVWKGGFKEELIDCFDVPTPSNGS